MPVKGRHNRAYSDLSKALERKARRLGLPCWICGRPIDWDADWRDPMSYTYDHDVPIAAGGDPRGPGRPAHRACNSRRGDGRREPKTIPPPRTTEPWG